MTVNGRAYRRQLWVPATSEIGGGLLPIGPDGTPGLPTPSACVANDGEKLDSWLARRERVKLTARNGNGMGMPLTIAAQLLPTPVAQTSQGGPKGLDGGSAARRMLADAGFPRAAGSPTPLLPTPKACDGDRGRDKARARPDDKSRELATVLRDRMLPTPRTCSAMAAPLDTPGNLQSDRFPNLETVMAQQLLTPTATDYKAPTNWKAAGRNGPQRLSDSLPTGAGMYLNPSFVEEMMGFPVGWTA